MSDHTNKVVIRNDSNIRVSNWDYAYLRSNDGEQAKAAQITVT